SVPAAIAFTVDRYAVTVELASGTTPPVHSHAQPPVSSNCHENTEGPSSHADKPPTRALARDLPEIHLTVEGNFMRLSTLGAVALVALAASPVRADDDGVGRIKVGVPNAVTPTPGVAQPTLLDPDFAVRLLATAENPLENPSGIITKFGILASGVRT